MGKRRFEDDGHTIADMSGVFASSGFGQVSRLYRHRRKKPKREDESRQYPEGISKREQRKYLFAAMRAGLLVALVFVVAIALFLLFCVFVWFR